MARLIQVLQSMPEPQGFKRFFLYYDLDYESAALPTVAKEWDANVRELSEALPLRETPVQELSPAQESAC